jgi:hypothetical protein
LNSICRVWHAIEQTSSDVSWHYSLQGEGNAMHADLWDGALSSTQPAGPFSRELATIKDDADDLQILL